MEVLEQKEPIHPGAANQAELSNIKPYTSFGADRAKWLYFECRRHATPEYDAVLDRSILRASRLSCWLKSAAFSVNYKPGSVWSYDLISIAS